ncbi:hypothetical protein M378DRAFT_181862 [Amanita muscaria Koide BX008]|uniref:Uncharacterized protein n=1 Tax=Amanita muscaria (strain Koide BX008) TaxID=946122 RepID=A0A0C2SRV9_AMAMK|nr:hypothetical protein M378DRAFT_181862 [Amanita muscaria Koide BX008]
MHVQKRNSENVKSSDRTVPGKVKRLMTMLNDHVRTFKTLIRSSPTRYLEGVCLKVLGALNEDEERLMESCLAFVQQRITTFENLHRDICSGDLDLLSLAGFADEIVKLEDITSQISHIISCLEDLCCTTSEGYQSLQIAYRKSNLLYQA